MKVVGDNCCWHVRHYYDTTDKPMHYEHLGANFNSKYSQNGHLQEQQTSIEKDQGSTCSYKSCIVNCSNSCFV